MTEGSLAGQRAVIGKLERSDMVFSWLFKNDSPFDLGELAHNKTQCAVQNLSYGRWYHHRCSIHRNRRQPCR